jgi:hypothetical protein
MPAHRLDVAADIVFGARGNAPPCQAGGWSVPEEGFTWAIGKASRLKIPYAAGNGVLMCELRAFAARVAQAVPAQRVAIVANGIACGGDTLTADTILAIPLTGIAEGQAGTVDLILHHPDAVVPADHGVSADRRALALAVRGLRLIWTPREAPFAPRHRPALRVPHPDVLGEVVRGCTGLAPGDLVGRFESLGHDCEFGLFPRMVGAEPLGLLRFGGIAPENLLAGLKCAFDGIDDPAQIALLRENNAGQEQYVVRSERYGMAFHSFIPTAGVTEAAMRTSMAAHLRFLRRKFAETLLPARACSCCITPPAHRRRRSGLILPRCAVGAPMRCCSSPLIRRRPAAWTTPAVSCCTAISTDGWPTPRCI